tara:strand:- start:302 stop:565 length:264 start_codon:yes stop_codon:yes gene_type:complete
MENKVIKIAGIEDFTNNWEKLHTDGKIFIFKYKRCFQLRYSKNAGYYAEEFTMLRLNKGKNPYTLRGRYVALNIKNANELVGRDTFV